MDKQQLMYVLREMSFLQDVDIEHLERIAEIAQFVSYDENAVVFRDGDSAENAYFVATGGVSLEMCAPGTGCRRILTMGPGELVGWSAVLGQSRLTATARAMNSTGLVQVHAGLLRTLCDHDPNFGYEIMRRTALALARRLSATRMQLLDLYGGAEPLQLEMNSNGDQDAR
jgi:CRP/FNR family transcriptional regulator, cyclic AMP receptor protein